jgi:hypothetical protein
LFSLGAVHTMTPHAPPPTAEQFGAFVREAFRFAAAHGFTEVPAQRCSDDPFQIWFRRGDEFIIVAGEGWGSAASVTLQHTSGVELPVIYLVAPESRPTRKRPDIDQLEQIREQASWLEFHGSDFLRGDLARFERLARPIPPYKRSPAKRLTGR